MSNSEQDKKDAIGAVFDQVDRDGIVVRSVSDGKASGSKLSRRSKKLSALC